MTEELLINISPSESRVAVLEDGILNEIFIERHSKLGSVGNIYLGTVVRVLPGMQAAFIDIGQSRTAFLHVNDMQTLRPKLSAIEPPKPQNPAIDNTLDPDTTTLAADWIVDLGPEGGSGGGEILVSGTPETVAECEASHTARFLKPMLK